MRVHQTRIEEARHVYDEARHVNDEERGAGSILVIATVAAIVAVAVLLVTVSGAFLATRSLAGTADASALAAADARAGFSSTPPCESAAAVAAANGARVAACEVDGTVVTVAVATSYMGLIVVQMATAGPPPAAAD